MAFLSKATQQQIRDAWAQWQANFGRETRFFSDNQKLEQLGNSNTDSSWVLLALELARLSEQVGTTCTFTAQDLTERPAEVQATLSLLRTMRMPADGQEIQSILKQTRGMLCTTAASFGAADKVNTTLSNSQLGELLRTAEQEFQRLRVHQFAQGTGKASHFHLNEWIYAFNSMHALVCALARQPVDGLTLCYILDPDIMEYSVFAWAVKTGTTLTVLSQETGLSHREQKFLRRNPGRDFERRTEGTFYPYSMFEFVETATASGSGTQVRIKGVTVGGETSIIQREDMQRLQRISALDPQEITWLILLANLIYRHYWEEEQHTAELAYTGEMLEQPQTIPQLLQGGTGPALLMSATPDITPVAALANYTPIELPAITNATLQAQGESGATWEGPSDVQGRTGRNDWMVRRYEHKIQVPKLVETPKQQVALPTQLYPSEDDCSIQFQHRIAGRPVNQQSPVVPITPDGSVTSHSSFLLNTNGWINVADSYPIRAFVPQGLFGTKAEIAQQRFYVARTNQAQAIQAMADKEFAERAVELVHWFQSAVKANLLKLKQAIAKGDMLVSGVPPDQGSFSNSPVVRENNILRINNKTAQHITASVHCGIVKKHDWHYFCVEEDSRRGSSHALFQPSTAAELAQIVGLQPSELPDVLQHWTSVPSGYIGNPILDRIDPMDNITNPWQRIAFTVQMSFTKTTLKRWQQAKFRDQPKVLITHYPEYSLEQALRLVPQPEL